MRRGESSSELRRLGAPLGRLLDALWSHMHWWVAGMLVLYALSGITVVRSDEVAVVKRWGRLVGSTPAGQVHGPGLLFAFPRPVDEVVRVRTKHVRELTLRTLAAPARGGAWGDTLDPLAVGYALTGDLNVIHVRMVARYRVRDPAEWAFRGPRSEDVVRTEVSAAMVRSLGEMQVDDVLAEKRGELIARATRRAQAGLDAAHSGLEIVSLELTDLSPPKALAPDFDAVQSAFIGAETQRKEAGAYAQQVVPRARAVADMSVRRAQAHAASALARARGQASAFLALEKEVKASPAVVKERLYRDAIERAISAADAVRWIPPPPAGGRYDGLRIFVSPGPASSGEPAPAPDAGSGSRETGSSPATKRAPESPR